MEQLRESVKPRAIKGVKRSLALEYIAKAENIEVTDEDVHWWEDDDLLKEKLEAKVIRIPVRADVDLEVAENLIIELYSKN